MAHWLFNEQIYTHMSVLTERTLVVERGLALHKMIRLVTYALGGEAWLNFEGNEFGHPEWLDFPREGNNESYKYARRLFYLCEDDTLRYKYLKAWDKAMNDLEEEYKWLTATNTFVSRKNEGDKVIIFERGDRGLMFIFNFHGSNSYADYRIGCGQSGKYKIVLDSDAKSFDGHGRINDEQIFVAENIMWDDRPFSFQVYTPCQTVLVLALAEEKC
ncbi:unnamed protein product [Rotaria sp. Silwood1]|nr:unnamed protein product [Rotaria sp. Silwood1]